MAVSTSSLSQVELVNWCKGEQVDVKHALLLYGVPEGVSREDIEKTAGNIKVLGRVVVRGKMFHPQQQSLMVLLECREEIDPSRIPPEIVPLSGGRGWKVIYYTEPQPDVFQEKLFAFLQSEGKTLEDIQGLDIPTKAGNGNPEDIIHAVGDVMNRANKQPDSHSYRRLRTFSGVIPTPVGEESFDNWLEQATLLVEEGECSDKEKRRHILESLKGPAFEIIQAVRLTKNDASPDEYIAAIESIFGTVQSAEELHLAFRNLHQQPGEHLSEFLRRLERSLVKVVQRGGLPVSVANSARLEQLLRGSTSALMLLQLRIRERVNNPPTLLALLREVMEEEARQTAKQSQVALLRQRVRTVQAQMEKETDSAIQDELQTQIQKLRAQLDEKNKSHPPSMPQDPSQGVKENRKKKTEAQSELQLLRKQVKVLENKVSVMTVKCHSDPSREPSTQPRRYQAGSGHKPSPKAFPSKDEERFCYRCGENGHIATRCSAPENPQKVISKLIRLVRSPPDPSKESPRPPAEEQCRQSQ